MTEFVDFYEILSVPSQSTREAIQRAYRRCALQTHPDKNPDRKQECEKRFHLLQKAVKVLTDPTKKAAFDKKRQSLLDLKRQREQLNKKRLAMMKDLERRETESANVAPIIRRTPFIDESDEMILKREADRLRKKDEERKSRTMFAKITPEQTIN